MLGIIFISVFFGAALSLLSTDEGCGNIVRGVESFNKVIIKMVCFQLVYLPCSLCHMLSAVWVVKISRPSGLQNQGEAYLILM